MEEENKAIIKCIKDYIKTCPYLNELSQINVDYLDVDSKDREYWSLEQLDVPIILKKNVLGTKTYRQCQFVLATRTFYNTINDTQNIKNLHLFEKIAEWFYQNTRKSILPTLNKGEIATSIESTTGGNLYGTSKDNTIARYQMTCKLLYEKEEENSIWH